MYSLGRLGLVFVFVLASVIILWNTRGSPTGATELTSTQDISTSWWSWWSSPATKASQDETSEWDEANTEIYHGRLVHSLKERKPKSILLVSAFFPLTKSKHTAEDYKHWIGAFLVHVSAEVYIFTTPEWAKVIASVDNAVAKVHVDTSFANVFSTPVMKPYKKEYQEKQWQLDREKDVHHPELYAIWNNKPYFLAEAARRLKRQKSSTLSYSSYDYYFWNDIGSFRVTHAWRQWPDATFVANAFKQAAERMQQPQDQLIFIPLYNALPADHTKDTGPVDMDGVEGSFYGGAASAIMWLEKAYYETHERYIKLNYFVDKDQTFLNALVLLFRDRFFSVPRHECADSWFYYQFWLASAVEKLNMQAIWGFSCPVNYLQTTVPPLPPP